MTTIVDVNLTFMFMSFIIGAILALISIVIRNNLIKVIVFLVGFLPIIAVLLGFIPTTGSVFDVTIQQATDQITNLLLVFVNVVLPYLIGVILSNAGGQFVNNMDNQIRGRY